MFTTTANESILRAAGKSDEMLEPYEWKRSCTVLRRERAGNRPDLADLKVFDKNSVYLPTKKIGKHNPREEEIKANNAARQEWNRTADMALISGIDEAKIGNQAS